MNIANTIQAYLISSERISVQRALLELNELLLFLSTSTYHTAGHGPNQDRRALVPAISKQRQLEEIEQRWVAGHLRLCLWGPDEITFRLVHHCRAVIDCIVVPSDQLAGGSRT